MAVAALTFAALAAAALIVAVVGFPRVETSEESLNVERAALAVHQATPGLLG